MCFIVTEPVRILVTAVGGDLGQALVKALRLGSLPARLLGCDLDAYGVGSAFVEEFASVPAAGDPAYAAAIEELVRAWKVDVVLPASEPEIRVLSEAKGRLAWRTPVVAQPRAWVRRFGDKLSCMRALEGSVELAPFADGADLAAVESLIRSAGLPLVVKPRRSSGSRGIAIARTYEELMSALATMSDPMVQAYLDESGGEFSVGVFRCRSFESAIAFRRTLGPVGCSWYAETVADPVVLAYAMQVSAAAQLEGAANVQVRKTERGVRLLEINPRFSSLVAARAASGFQDAEWAVRVALGEEPTPPSASRPIRFRRFFHEMIDYGDGFHALPAWSPRQALSDEM
jgi:carbamoyl-phosphate synthase large subunit